jgi:hypothetical protein
MSFIESKYIGLVSVRLQKFAKKKVGLYNFRCPYCGDSSTSKNKARGYLYQVRSDYNFKCHNCGVCRSFPYFLKDQDPLLYDEYVMERYRDGLTGKGTVVEEPKFEFKKPEFKQKTILSELDTIDALNTSHPAKQYLINRKVPEKNLKQLYFCPDFKKWTNKHLKVFSNTDLDDERIIIPLKDLTGNLFGYQGRSLNPKSKLRYITVMLDESSPKVFGLDFINQNQKIYVTEGPFDSLFLNNSIAMCGADVSLKSFGFSDVVYVLDNEPRNLQIVNRLSKLIDNEEQVVIYPKEVNEKDLNEMVLSGRDVQRVVECNTYSGLEAKLKLLEWKKV